MTRQTTRRDLIGWGNRAGLTRLTMGRCGRTNNQSRNKTGGTHQGGADNHRNRKHEDRKWGTETTGRKYQNKTGNMQITKLILSIKPNTK